MSDRPSPTSATDETVATHTQRRKFTFDEPAAVLDVPHSRRSERFAVTGIHAKWVSRDGGPWVFESSGASGPKVKKDGGASQVDSGTRWWGYGRGYEDVVPEWARAYFTPPTGTGPVA